MTNYIECFLDSARGQYIPRDFALIANREKFIGVTDSEWDELEQGPEFEFYLETWDSVLDNAQVKETGQTLYLGESGDLFLIDADSLKSDFDQYIESCVEYETTHEDSGSNYGTIVCESYGANIDKGRIKKWCIENGIETCGLDSNQLMYLALDVFEMQSEHMFRATPDNVFCIESFPIGEIEIQIPDDMQFPFLDSDSAYIADCGSLAYVTTDSIWQAIVTIEAMKTAIEEN